MRLLAIPLIVCGCEAGERPRLPTPEPPTPLPVPAPAPAPADVELIRNVPGVTVTVSSQVKNPRILPKHLIDRDMQTAWNTRTGQLAGAWIEIAAPAGTRIRELRLTVGHTGKGPKGEDYFTMNPRIVKILVDDAMVTLDPSSRELQSIPVHAEKVRLTIAELRPGTKRAWREVAISELEAWGTPPPDGSGDSFPEVDVGGTYGDFCPRVDALNAERHAEREQQAEMWRHSTDDPVGCGSEGAAGCDTRPLDVTDLASWPVPMRTCETYDHNFGPTTCWTHVETDRAIVLAQPPMDTGAPIQYEPQASLQDIVKGGTLELVLRENVGVARPDDSVVICRAEPLSCTAPERAATAFSHPPAFR